MTVQALDLHGQLSKLGVDAILFNTSEVLRSVNLRYLSGFSGSDAALLITHTERCLFTDGRYGTQAREESPGFRVNVVRKKIDALAAALKRSGVVRLGVESSRVSHEFVVKLQQKARGIEIVSLARKFLDGLRLRKGAEEKECIKAAAEIASKSCAAVVNGALAGRTELDVAAELEDRFKRAGAEAIAFETIVASGERAALPHGKASGKPIREGELVVIDFGCRLRGYNSDETVTCVVGSPSADHSRMHHAVYAAHMKAIDALKPGILVRSVDAAAREVIEEAGYGNYFTHGLGHGVGLEVHEPPHISSVGTGVIEEGMVFTIEPGVYIQGVGGVRLESLVYMGAAGPEILSGMTKDLIAVH
jgi:Xaa-Pro aminopeptidase